MRNVANSAASENSVVTLKETDLRLLIVNQKETNILLKKILKSCNDSRQYLSAICQENIPTTNGESLTFNDNEGRAFSTSELSRSNPNSFAIAFLRRIYGHANFANIILDPCTPISDHLRVVDSKIVDDLKCALSVHFNSFLYSKVRKSVNQAARDQRKKR